MQPALAHQRKRPLAELLDDVANVILYLASDESRSFRLPVRGREHVRPGVAGL